MTTRCTQCDELNDSQTLKVCNNGDCRLCSICAIKCDECERLGQGPQCPRTKTCNRPSLGSKKRVRGRICPKCNVKKTLCCDSYGMIITVDKCPHGWCHVCEIHQPDHNYYGCSSYGEF